MPARRAGAPAPRAGAPAATPPPAPTAPGGEVVALDERLRLLQRPRRRHHRVAPQTPQGLHAPVAVDEHEPLPRGDHHHRHLLSHLRQGRGQPPPSHRVVNAQVRVPQLELVQLQVHARTLSPPGHPGYLVLPAPPRKVCRIPLSISGLVSASRLAHAPRPVAEFPPGSPWLAPPSRLARGPRVLSPAAAARARPPHAVAQRPGPPSPAAAARGRSRDSGGATDDRPGDAAGAGTPPHRTSLAAPRPEAAAETNDGTPNRVASSTRLVSVRTLLVSPPQRWPSRRVGCSVTLPGGSLQASRGGSILASAEDRAP